MKIALVEGFDGLTWDYEKDKDIACSLDSTVIRDIQALANRYQTALSFGYFELVDQAIYSSQLFIGCDGRILANYRRQSPGWKETQHPSYMEGRAFTTFSYQDKTFLLAICGDLWQKELLTVALEKDYDILLWPVYLDYTIKEWQEEGLADYCQQVKNSKRPVCMVNSYQVDQVGAVGGAIVFQNGRVNTQLPLGQSGITVINL